MRGLRPQSIGGARAQMHAINAVDKNKEMREIPGRGVFSAARDFGADVAARTLSQCGRNHKRFTVVSVQLLEFSRFCR
jgi:hypothetical protein